MNSIKIAGVCNWPIPKNCTDLQAFLGFINFYQRFIYGFSEVVYPLFNLTGSNSTWMWTAPQQDAFNFLKMAIISVPILVSPNTFALF